MDLDGTITPYDFYNSDIPLPRWLCYFLSPFLLLQKPKKAVVKKMQLMEAQGYQFKIITARPKQCFQSTEQLLIRHRVPFVGLSCVEGGKRSNERKLKVIREEKIEVFVDSNKRIVEFLKRNSVNAVNSLEYFN